MNLYATFLPSIDSIRTFNQVEALPIQVNVRFLWKIFYGAKREMYVGQERSVITRVVCVNVLSIISVKLILHRIYCVHANRIRKQKLDGLKFNATALSRSINCLMIWFPVITLILPSPFRFCRIWMSVQMNIVYLLNNVYIPADLSSLIAYHKISR